jgi:hypothetical protein
MEKLAGESDSRPLCLKIDKTRRIKTKSMNFVVTYAFLNGRFPFEIRGFMKQPRARLK